MKEKLEKFVSSEWAVVRNTAFNDCNKDKSMARRPTGIALSSFWYR
jgi:hypothetical protein